MISEFVYLKPVRNSEYKASYGRISLVAPGTTYPYVATAANGWHAVEIGSKVGWVSGEYSKTI